MLELKELKEIQQKQGLRDYTGPRLTGPRFEIAKGEEGYPSAFLDLAEPPEVLFGIGDPNALCEGLAIVGARKATKYGLSCAEHFSSIASKKGICIISGGAIGCDGMALRAAVEVPGRAVAFLGGGCDNLYPASHYGLFQDMVDNGGAVVSENPWTYPSLPFMFRRRNRLIASLARATLIVEAGLPSGTFSTADEALDANREVFVVPGAITSPSSHGSNRLILQGATPIIDDESFEDALSSCFGLLRQEIVSTDDRDSEFDPLLASIRAQAMTMEELYDFVETPDGGIDAASWLARRLCELEFEGKIARYPDGRYGPVL